jgi:hypothetical protein
VTNIEGVIHAKTMGSVGTVCGADTSTWIKLWDVPFASSPAPRCDKCCHGVQVGGAA